jgi:hypothetical protein
MRIVFYKLGIIHEDVMGRTCCSYMREDEYRVLVEKH